MSRNRRNSLVSAVRHGTAVSLLVIGRAVLVEILRARREKLSLIAEHLIEVETIEGAKLDSMLLAG